MAKKTGSRNRAPSRQARSSTNEPRRQTTKARPRLTHEDLARAYDDIAAEIAKRSSRWNSRGWAIVGTKQRPRVEVAVERTLRTPAHPIAELEIPGLGSIKPAVRMLARSPFPRPVFPFAALANVVDEPLAPGARIIVQSSPLQRAGIACVVSADDDKYLVTCGHAFERDAESTGVFTRGHRIASLTHNFLEDEDQLDAAVCRLTQKGFEFLAASTDAETWFEGALQPVQGHGKAAEFFPTNDDANDVITTTINSHAASSPDISNDFWPSLKLDRLIRTEPIATHGDSGSLLVVEGRYYGLCSGTPNFSFFTPIHTAIERISAALNTEVTVWSPDES